MTPPTRALISWIGDMDLIEYAQNLTDKEKEALLEDIDIAQNKNQLKEKIQTPPFFTASPLKTILTEYGSQFKTLFLLTNRAASFLNGVHIPKNHHYKTFLKSSTQFSGNIQIVDLSKEIKTITNIQEVYPGTKSFFENNVRNHYNNVACNLTSGVGITTTILVLLASAYSDECSFFQTHKKDVALSELPESFSQLIRHERRIKSETIETTTLHGKSHEMKSVLHRATTFAEYPYPILILGPSGCGKTTLAQEIHKVSGRSGTFEMVNCGSLTPTLLESTLFGHVKGAFTGAEENKDGLFKRADRGTLFLDEIADCPLEMQTMLLHVLQPRDPRHPTQLSFRKMQAAEEEKSDVRIIAATNRPIEQLIREGKFREDLFYRLNALCITIPPLAQRKEDVAPIAENYISQINLQNKHIPGYQPKTLTKEAIERLKQHDWPGNVRELQHILQTSVVLMERLKEEINAEDIQFPHEITPDIPLSTLPDPREFSIEAIKDALEQRYISLALEKTNGQKTAASKLLGLKSPQHLDSRIQALNNRLKTPIKQNK